MENSALEEFLVLKTSELGEPTPQEVKSFIWTSANTLILLDLYKKYRNQVGTLQIRNFKKMWEIISNDFKKLYDILVSPSNCENRWRVLDRNYKKFIDNKKQTGAGRKYFEFAEQMDDILGKKKNINPSILLSTNTICEVKQSQNSVPIIEAELNEIESQPSCSSWKENVPDENKFINKKSKVEIRSKRILKNRNSDILDRIRKEKIDRHNERLNFDKEKFEKIYELEIRKQEARERKNNLLEINNKLQKENNNNLQQILQNLVKITEY